MTSDHGGVQTRNLYDLLDEDDTPTPTPKPKEEVKKESKKDAPRTSDRARATPRVDGGDRRTDGGDRGGRGRGGARGGRGRGGGGRGGGGGDSGFRERKEYDAHISRTGKTREPKKEGAGKYNEGSLSDVIADGTNEDRRRRRPRKEEDEAPATETKAETEGTEATDATGEEAPVEEKSTPALEVVEEEPATRTYDEFLASKQKLEADLAIQRREAQNDETQFKPVKVHTKNEEQNPYIIASAAEEKEKAKKVKKDKAKHISFDEFIATANNSGNRGGYRGRGGRGRGGRGDARSLAVTDSNFPALDKTVDKPAEKGTKEKK